MLFRIYHLARKLIGGNYYKAHTHTELKHGLNTNDVVDDDVDDFYEYFIPPRQSKREKSIIDAILCALVCAMEKRRRRRSSVGVMPQIE